MDETTRWFRYVKIEDIPRFMARGWEWDDRETPLHAPHGCYAVVMEWRGDGEPREPRCENVREEVQV